MAYGLSDLISQEWKTKMNEEQDQMNLKETNRLILEHRLFTRVIKEATEAIVLDLFFSNQMEFD